MGHDRLVLLAVGRAANGLCVALFLVACGEPGLPFQVVGVVPSAGEVVAPEVEVALTLSEPPDWTTCTERAVHLVRTGDSGQVVVRAAVEIVSEGETTMVVEHDALAAGRWQVAVQTGVDGCLSSFGQGVAPFSSDFLVASED